MDRTGELYLNNFLLLRVHDLWVEKIGLNMALLNFHFVARLLKHAMLFTFLLILIFENIAAYLFSLPQCLHQQVSVVIFEAGENVLDYFAVNFLADSN